MGCSSRRIATTHRLYVRSDRQRNEALSGRFAPAGPLHANGRATAKGRCSAPRPSGLQPKRATRRNVEQGPGYPGMRPCRRVWGTRNIRRSPVPLRGRIQAQYAWNLLLPTRDALSQGLPISTYWLRHAWRIYPVLIATHHVRGREIGSSILRRRNSILIAFCTRQREGLRARAIKMRRKRRIRALQSVNSIQSPDRPVYDSNLS